MILPRLVLTILFVFIPHILPAEVSPIFRIGFSASIFTDINQNDAIAAVRAWSFALAKEKNIPANPEPLIFRDIADIKRALSENKVDCINLSTVEFFKLRHLLDGKNIVVAVNENSITEEYVVIVNKSKGIRDISQLRGRSLAIQHNPKTSLATIWLDTFLAKAGIMGINAYFGQKYFVPKADKAVLPVFFQQIDACMVTRKSFNTMAELNPQIGEQLQILAASPPLVPVIFSFRGNYDSPVKQLILKEIASWHLSPSGRQILTIFHTDRLAEHASSSLDNALALLAEYRNVFPHATINDSLPVQ